MKSMIHSMDDLGVLCMVHIGDFNTMYSTYLKNKDKNTYYSVLTQYHTFDIIMRDRYV